MKRWIHLLPVMLLAACAVRSASEPAAPDPGPVARTTGTATIDPAPAILAAVEPPLVATLQLDSLDAEITDELRLAEDSAADAEILAQLDSTATPDSESDGGYPGGANDIGASAVTWDIDVQTFTNHDRVQYYLSFFQGPARERFGIWLTRMPRYEAMVRQRLSEQGLPGDLVYLALIESGFSNTAVSRARAAGMWQFMKGTARLYGLRVDAWVDERRDPYRATEAAARHLRDLRNRFGSLYLAAAAYNAGAGKVSRGIARMDEDSLTDSTFFRLYDTRLLRLETKDYVPKLIAAALIAKEPERYGFPPMADSTPQVGWDSIIVHDATGLDVIARLADTTVAAVRELNPMYLRMATPPRSRSVIRVPRGTGPQVAASYAALPPRARVTFQEHFVTKGQTLGEIARRYGVSVSDIADANPGLKPTRLRIGQRIVIPTGGVSAARAAVAAADERRETVRRTVASGHTVRRGETLSGIADRYAVTVAQLRAWNGLGGSSAIRAGQRLRVRAATTSASSSAARRPSTAAGRTHVVRAGDTLSEIADRYNVSVTALRSANGLGRSSTIRVGQKLRVPG